METLPQSLQDYINNLPTSRKGRGRYAFINERRQNERGYAEIYAGHRLYGYHVINPAAMSLTPEEGETIRAEIDRLLTEAGLLDSDGKLTDAGRLAGEC